MTTATLTERDIDHLLSLLGELTWAGRTDEATTIARLYTLACSVLYPDLFDDEDEGEELARALEEAERDFEAGRCTPHEDVVRRLQALDHPGGTP